MSSDARGSVTMMIANLRAGEETIAQHQLWDRYFRRLLALARAKIGNTPRAAADEEDVVLSAFQSLFRGMNENRFPELNDRNNLWSLLAKITARKAINQRNWHLAQKRGGSDEKRIVSIEGAPEESLAALELVDSEIGPELLVAIREECRRLMEALPEDRLREIARRKLEGYSNAEIATELGVVERTVERKLQLIRAVWAPDEIESLNGP